MSSSWAAALRASLALDLRSLALTRSLLAVGLLLDALCRLGNISLLYADAGLLPRPEAMILMGNARLSLHLLNGSMPFVLLLGTVQALAALALLLGWRTRQAGIVLWLLLVSTAARNPLVVTAADGLAIALLFWGNLLPWSARWSVDAALGRAHVASNSSAHGGWASALLLLQVLALPLLGGLAQREALASAFAGTGAAITAYPLLLAMVLPLALLPRLGVVPRRVALGIFVVGGIGSSLYLCAGLPAWIGLSAAALLIDAGLWARLSPEPSGNPLRVYTAGADGKAARLALLLREFLCVPRLQVLDVQDSPRAARLLPSAQAWVLIDRDDTAHLDDAALRVLLASSPLLRVLKWSSQAASATGARSLQWLLRLLPVSPRATPPAEAVTPTQASRLRWVLVVVAALSLFGQFMQPDAANRALQRPLEPLGLDLSWTTRTLDTPQSGWIVIPGETTRGDTVDARSVSGGALRFTADQPPLLRGTRGRRYEQRLLADDADLARAALARRLCAQSGGALARLRIVRVTPAASGDAAQAEQHVLLRQDCR